MTKSTTKQASRWLARLDREDVSPQDRAAFEAWRTADARHAADYAELETVWKRLDRLRTPDALVSVAPTRRFRIHAPWAAATSVAALACVAALVIAFVISRGTGPTQPDIATTQRYVTAVGGHERAALNDGSIAELNTDTELSVILSEAERRIELLRGEASFEVADDPHRPFIVAAGDLTIRAVGTVFNVRRREEGVEVLVVQGKVALETAVGSTIIQAGETAITAPAGLKIHTLKSEQLKRTLAWHKGKLAFDDVTLIEAAREFNRYNIRRLVVTDPAIANRRIGGYFDATNVDGFVRGLEATFAITATRSPTEIRLSRAPPPAK